MQTNSHYQPVFEFTRGERTEISQAVESIHFGAIAVVDASGRMVAWHGDPQTITYLRSTAKPFQALPLLERNGAAFYSLTLSEIAVICASHSGTDEQVETVRSIQTKTGVSENELMCGVHPLSHAETIKTMQLRGESLSPNRHNCSGKHTGMLALSRMQGVPAEGYTELQHPIQQIILHTFAEMCDLAPHQVQVGIDGCSVPTFAVPLYNAALAYARLCDPQAGNVSPPSRTKACQTIVHAMTSHPQMVGGPGRFDTLLMEVGQGRILSKGGAEGYQGLGLLAGTIHPNSPAMGIAIKVSDGDLKSRALPSVSLEVLQQLGALSEVDMNLLKEFGPQVPVHNWRKLLVGQAKPCFQLQHAYPQSN